MLIYNSLQYRKKVSPKDMEQAQLELNKNPNWITLLSDNYPDFLKKWYKPPFMVEIKENKVYYIYGVGLKQRFEIKPPKTPLKELTANNQYGATTIEELDYYNFIKQFNE